MNVEQKRTEKNTASGHTPHRRLSTIARSFLAALLLINIVPVDASASSSADTGAMTEAAINKRIAPVAGFVLVDPHLPNTSTTDNSLAAPPRDTATATTEQSATTEQPVQTAAALAASPTSIHAEAPPVAAEPPGSTINPTGEKLYNTNCFACHNAAIAGAPKLGNKAVWAPYIATGMDAMMEVVIRGKGAMPPKGGAMNASEEDLRAAVQFMLNAVK